MTKLEYIWISPADRFDVKQLYWPTFVLRSKTKVVEDFNGDIHSCPTWGFDGSSTNQAKTNNSDLMLMPVKLYENPLEENCYLVMCEVWDTIDTPYPSNGRARLRTLMEDNDQEPWFGFEQEYTLYKNGKPLGWPEDGEPAPQGDYYCGRNAGENIAREHMDMCMEAGIGIVGINSEVMLGQWEYQIFGSDAFQATDDLWVARWLLEKIAAEYDVSVSLDPKPIEGDWNGAGCHTNFSTKAMREEGGDLVIYEAVESMERKHKAHLALYGVGNEKRLTGKHETCDMDTFRWGIMDRGASIRIPWQVDKDKKGYFEDRRPSANCDPYMVAYKLILSICGGTPTTTADFMKREDQIDEKYTL